MARARIAPEKAAANGAKLLDKLVPRWWEEIKTSILDLSNSACCIIGQLHGDYSPTAYFSDVIGLNDVHENEEGLKEDPYLRIPGLTVKEHRTVNIQRSVDVDEELNGFYISPRLGVSSQAALYSRLTEAWLMEIEKRRIENRFVTRGAARRK